MKVAVIPARGGSKRIPRKNIKNFLGKPMIAWSIETAIASELFDKIIISTDDDEIAEIATQYGAEVPFVRPAELANDYTGTTEVIAHATQWAVDKGWQISAVCCIYATAPFIQVEDLRQGWQALESGNWAYAFSVTDFAAPIFRAFREHPDGGIEMFFPEHFLTRSQDLPRALHDAGQFYWGQPSAWLESKRIFDRHSVPILIPRWCVQDIDNEEDWIRAEMIAPMIINKKS
jgi:pseudaminic acid cytidylyltransferase